MDLKVQAEGGHGGGLYRPCGWKAWGGDGFGEGSEEENEGMGAR